MSDLVGNAEDHFFHNEAKLHLVPTILMSKPLLELYQLLMIIYKFESQALYYKRHENV